MNYFYCLIFLLLSLRFAYPYPQSNDADHFLNKYLRQQLNSINGKAFIRRQLMFPISPIQQQQPQILPICLPHIWTCGPGLPRCCPSLMCYDGNAKRGRYCVARG